MKTILTLSLFLLVIKTLAQLEVPSAELIQKFYKTTTCFVLDDNPFSESNIQLKSAAEKFWKLTPYEIIGVEEYEKRRKQTKYSFVSIDEVYFDNTKNPVRYKFLCLYLGGNYATDSDMPQLTTIPLAYTNEEEANYAHKIGTLLIFLQQHIQTVQKNPQLKKSNIIEYYQQNLGTLKNKALWLVKDEVEPKLRNETFLKSIYPYNIKLVTHDDIEAAIDNRNPDVVFLHKVGTPKNGSKTYKILIDTQNAQLYYFDYHTVSENKPDAFLETDLKKLIK